MDEKQPTQAQQPNLHIAIQELRHKSPVPQQKAWRLSAVGQALHQTLTPQKFPECSTVSLNPVTYLGYFILYQKLHQTNRLPRNEHLLSCTPFTPSPGPRTRFEQSYKTCDTGTSLCSLTITDNTQFEAPQRKLVTLTGLQQHYLVLSKPEVHFDTIRSLLRK